MPASSSGNSPARKQVTGLNWIWAPVPVVSAKMRRDAGRGLLRAGGSVAGGSRPQLGGVAPGGGALGGGNESITADGTAASSRSALAVLPSTTTTRTGACFTVRPTWLSVVTVYSPTGAGVSKVPSSRDVARTTAPVCSSMKATVTPDFG